MEKKIHDKVKKNRKKKLPQVLNFLSDQVGLKFPSDCSNPYISKVFAIFDLISLLLFFSFVLHLINFYPTGIKKMLMNK